jgi:Ser/Thr protein kinase RdoA (MazF antagonist)
MFWLSALKRDTDIRITEPVARRDGEYITIVSAPGVPGERRCALFSWVPGQTLGDHLRPENHYKFGQTLARLHDHAKTLNPLPSHIQPKKWDKAFYYPNEPVVYNTPEYSHLFPPERIKLLEDVIEHADRVFERLFANEDGQILIHGDLHYWNVHYHRGELYVIDFEDINLGFPVQDIVISLYTGRLRDDYNELRTAFEDGYRDIRSWPSEDERTIQTLMAARSVMFINYAARISASPEEYIENRCQELVRYLELYG